MVSVPPPARLYGPGSPTPRTPATKARATSSSCTSWKRMPGSGSTGFSTGTEPSSRATASGIASPSRKYGISWSIVRASGPATMQGRKTYADVPRWRSSTSPSTRSTSAFCCE